MARRSARNASPMITSRHFVPPRLCTSSITFLSAVSVRGICISEVVSNPLHLTMNPNAALRSSSPPCV